MPLSEFQKSVVRVLSPFRSKTNFVGGGAVLNKNWARISDDLDIFDDRRSGLPDSVTDELSALKDADFGIEITTEDEWMIEAIIRKYGFETKIQWMDEPETSKRFFSAIIDDELGFRLHQADVAVNKVLCAVRRNQAARDAVDLVSIVQNYAPLGPLIWAVSSKDSNLTPPRVLQGIRKNIFGYADEEIRAIRVKGEAFTRNDIRRVLEPALDRGEEYCSDVALESELGALFVDSGEKPVEANEKQLISGEVVAVALKDFAVTPKIMESDKKG